MRPTRRQTLTAAALLAALAVAPAAAAPAAEPGDMSLGNPKAPVKVVEYASASCGHCAHFNETVFPQLKAKYIDTGRVHYTLKEFLTPPERVSAAGFLLARCGGAAPAKYFKVLDEVFRSQARWTSGATVLAELKAVAAANGLSDAQFESCLSDQAALTELEGRANRAVADGVRSTPTVYVNGKVVAAHTFADLDAAIAAAAKPAGRR